MSRAIGILGGMGALATADLFQKCVENTQAASDQDHIHIYVDCNTEIPDRTASILNNGENPLPKMVRSAVKLESMGAELLIMPCNTAHYFYDQLRSFVTIPILHMLRITAQAVRDLGMDCVGLLATDGTIQTGIYESIFSEYHIHTVKPNRENQQFIMDLIYRGIKGGDNGFDVSPMELVVDQLHADGAQSIILGCTELPVAFSKYRLPYPHIDPTLLLARAAIQAAGGQLKNEQKAFA